MILGLNTCCFHAGYYLYIFLHFYLSFAWFCLRKGFCINAKIVFNFLCFSELNPALITLVKPDHKYILTHIAYEFQIYGDYCVTGTSHELIYCWFLSIEYNSISFIFTYIYICTVIIKYCQYYQIFTIHHLSRYTEWKL